MIALVLAAVVSAGPVAEDVAAVDRPKLEEIYTRPELSRARLRNQGTLEQLMHRLRLWFESFFESRGAESYSVVSRFIVLVIAALAAGWAALRLLSRRSQRGAHPGAAPKSETALQLDDPAAHLGRARAQLSANPRAAIREGLLSLLSALERARFARPDRVKTNRELAKELPARGAPGELTARVEALLGWYDRTFYSLEPVQAAEAARFLDDVEQVKPA